MTGSRTPGGRPPGGRPPGGTGRIFARLFAWLIAAVVAFTVGFFALVELYPFDASKLTEHHEPTVVYDKNGQQYMTIAGQGAYDLTYDQLPKDLVNAVVATEDHNFWDSSSIDFKGILRAAFIDLWTQSYAQGASTIQEQLAKIVYLNDKKTLSRKFSQIVLGVQINRHFTKQEILAMYLNRSFFGENAVGVGQAAYRYFGVDLRKQQNLTLSQAALLAGLLQAPSAYDPIQHPDAAIKRRNQVLDNMVKYGYITEAEANAAKAQTIRDMGVAFHNVPDDAWDNHPLFTNFLFHYAEQAGIPQEELLQGGLKVYTTVDPKVQKAIDTVFWSTNYNGDFPGPTSGTVAQGAAIFIDPKTGGVLGAAGSRKQGFVPLGMDRALQAYRSPGSSIKPLVVYGPAIESGKFGPDSVLNNQPHDFGGGYAPRNDNQNAPAQVTLRYALATSQNVAAVWTLQQIGIQTGADFAANAGIPITDGDRQHLNIALGGLEKGVSPFIMAQAYSAFANQGIEPQAHLIDKVVNDAGDTLYTFEPAAKRVMSAHTAAVMTDLLQGVVQYGTGTAAQVPGWGVAGKTGTVQYDATQSGEHQNWINAGWFDGYTPTMVGSIYLGYDVPSPEHHLTDIPHSPSYNAAKIFGDIVKLATQGMPPQQFGQTSDTQPQSTQAVYGLNATWDPVAQAVQVTWKTDLSGRVVFQISRQDNGPAATSGSPDVIGQTTQPFYEDAAVQPGESYTYTVQALDLTTQQPVGSPVSITVTLDTASGAGPGSTGGTPADGANTSGGTGGFGNGTDTGPGNTPTGDTGGTAPPGEGGTSGAPGSGSGSGTTGPGSGTPGSGGTSGSGSGTGTGGEGTGTGGTVGAGGSTGTGGSGTGPGGGPAGGAGNGTG